jgi:hypothetical protein
MQTAAWSLETCREAFLRPRLAFILFLVAVVVGNAEALQKSMSVPWLIRENLLWVKCERYFLRVEFEKGAIGAIVYILLSYGEP